MGHVIEYRDFPENADKSDVRSALDEYVRMADWQEGCSGLYRDIRWYGNPPLENEQAAEEFLRRHDDGEYDNLAVRYQVRDRVTPKKSKKLADLQDRIGSAYDKYKELNQGSYLKGLKISFIGCRSCGSKLNVSKLISNRRLGAGANSCPVCGADLRPESAIEKERRAEQAWKKTQEDYCAEVEREEKRQKVKEIRWLVKYEFHE